MKLQFAETQDRELFLDMVKHAKYEVGEAKESDNDAYTIDITVEPFIAFEGIQEEVTASLTEEISNMTEIPSDEELNQMVFQRMYDLMAARMEDPAYGDPAIVTITVQPDADGVYYISQEDMTALDDAMFPADSF